MSSYYQRLDEEENSVDLKNPILDHFLSALSYFLIIMLFFVAAVFLSPRRVSLPNQILQPKSQDLIGTKVVLIATNLFNLALFIALTLNLHSARLPMFEKKVHFVDSKGKKHLHLAKPSEVESVFKIGSFVLLSAAYLSTVVFSIIYVLESRPSKFVTQGTFYSFGALAIAFVFLGALWALNIPVLVYMMTSTLSFVFLIALVNKALGV